MTECLSELTNIENKIEDKYYNFLQKFIIFNKVGSGGFGEVWLACYKKTYKLCAIKYIKKKEKNIEYNKEIDIMEKLKKKSNICEIYEYYENEFNLIIVMEYLPGKELFDYINISIYKEDIVKKIFIQILTGIKHIHDEQYIHRDIKPENIIINNIDNKDISVKLIDFGLAEYCDDTTILTNPGGSEVYMAPEVYKKKYTKQADIYSLGVILYIMLCGEHPYYNHNNIIKKNSIILNEVYWFVITENAKKLVLSMLEIDPDKRIKINDIFNHPWITNSNPKKK